MLRNGGNYNQTLKALADVNALISSSKRKTLGAGTNYEGGSHPCLEIYLKAPALGQVVAASVSTLQAVGKAKTS